MAELVDEPQPRNRAIARELHEHDVPAHPARGRRDSGDRYAVRKRRSACQSRSASNCDSGVPHRRFLWGAVSFE